MAKSNDDSKTGELPVGGEVKLPLGSGAYQPTGNDKVELFTTDEKQWLKVSLTNQIRSLERMMAKYPAGSGAYQAHGNDVEALRKIMAKV